MYNRLVFALGCYTLLAVSEQKQGGLQTCTSVCFSHIWSAEQKRAPHSWRDVTQEDDSSALTEPMHGSSRLLAEYVEGRECGCQGTLCVLLYVYVCVSKTKPDWVKFKRISSHWRYLWWKTTHFCQSDQTVLSVQWQEVRLFWIGYRVLIKAPVKVYGDETCVLNNATGLVYKCVDKTISSGFKTSWCCSLLVCVLVSSFVTHTII